VHRRGDRVRGGGPGAPAAQGAPAARRRRRAGPARAARRARPVDAPAGRRVPPGRRAAAVPGRPLRGRPRRVRAGQE
jgi:hypothetical protein